MLTKLGATDNFLDPTSLYAYVLYLGAALRIQGIYVHMVYVVRVVCAILRTYVATTICPS